jgi:hypothetical protein
MNYTILLYEAPADFALRKDPARQPAYSAGWGRYTKALIDAGIFVAGAGMQGPDSATTLRLRDGQRLVQDGPYAETKEQLGGFYVINVPDLDTALDWASRCPCLPNGTVEVRPNLPPKAA